jgi:hypothetical protein
MSASEKPKKPNGNEYRCTLSRHIPSLRLQGMWAQVERLVNLAEYEKSNASKPRNQWNRPILFAAITTLADACNVSYNTGRACIKEFVKKGLLTPRFEMGKEPTHLPSGRWQTHDYDVALHDDYARFCPCPPYRFCRREGALGVKAEQRKVAPEKVGELTQRFRQKADAWVNGLLQSFDAEGYCHENPPPPWPKDSPLTSEEWVEVRRKDLEKVPATVARY